VSNKGDGVAEGGKKGKMRKPCYLTALGEKNLRMAESCTLLEGVPTRKAKGKKAGKRA